MGDRKGVGISNDEARGRKECGVREDTGVVCHMRGANCQGTSWTRRLEGRGC